MRFNLLQSFPFRFWEEYRGGDEVNYGTSSKTKKHGRVTMLADGGQKHGGDGGRNGLINQQGNAHTVRANPRWHQFRKRQPHAHSRSDREKRHEDEETNRHQPAIVSGRQRRDQCIVNSEGSLARRIKIAKWIREKRDYFVGGNAALARNLNRLRGRVVRTRNLGGSAEISVRIDDDQRGGPVADRLAGVSGRSEERVRSLLVVKQRNLLVGIDHGLNRSPGIHAQLFSSAKQQAGAEERHDDASAAYRQQELASLAVYQQHA